MAFRYTKMMTIDRPLNMSDTEHYGDFDMAHLVICFRELTDPELQYLPKIALDVGSNNDLDCCIRKKRKAIF